MKVLLKKGKMKEEEVSVGCLLSLKEARVILLELYKADVVAR